MIADQKSNLKIVGFFLIDGDPQGAKLAISRKPNWFRKFFTWLVLGWKYKKVQ